MVPLLNRHFSWEAVHLPMKFYSQLLREASHVKPIWCPLIVSSLFFKQIRKEHSISHRRGTAAKYVQLRSAGGGAVASFLAVLGPGLLAGLSDDDPAGITTAWSSSSDSGS
jgi:hypothetical protein